MKSFEEEGSGLQAKEATHSTLASEMKLFQSQMELLTRTYNLEAYKTNKYIRGLFGTDAQLTTAFTAKYPGKSPTEIRSLVAGERAAINERIPKAVTTLQSALNTLCASESYYATYGKLIDPVELFSLMLQETSLYPKTGGGDEEGYFQILPADPAAGIENATVKADSILTTHRVPFKDGNGYSNSLQLTMKGITFFLHTKRQTLKDISGHSNAVSFTEAQKQQLCYFTYNKGRARLTKIINHLKITHKPVTFDHIKTFLYETSGIKSIPQNERVQFSQFFNDNYKQYGLNRDASTRDVVANMTPYQASVGLNYMIHVHALKQGITKGVSQVVEVTPPVAEAPKNLELQQGIHFVRSSYVSPFSMIKALYGEDLQKQGKTVMNMIDTLTRKGILLKQDNVVYEPDTIPDVRKLRALFMKK